MAPHVPADQQSPAVERPLPGQQYPAVANSGSGSPGAPTAIVAPQVPDTSGTPVPTGAPGDRPWAVRCDPTPVDAAEAAALAGAFAADYLSWDQDDPGRRGRVLSDHLAVAGSDPAHLGWSGHGRQRADFALPGRVRPDGEGRVLVDVRVRVTPYRSVGEHGPIAAEPEPDLGGTPAAAPAPTGRGWRSLPASWIRISVPVVSDGERLVVDAWEETLGETPPVATVTPVDVASDDHTLADDDPLLEPGLGGAW